MKSFLYFCLATVAFVSPTYAQDLTQEQFDKYSEEAFRPVIDEFNIPGMAIGLTLNGQQYFYVTGLASRADAIPVDADTLFELGSVSKLFNVTLAALAEQEGMFSLDDKVADVMPSLEGSAFDSITLYDLAAHANGGLPLQVPDTITGDRELVDWLAAWNPPGTPQETRGYSNLSIGLLGKIAGDQYGGSYATAMEKHLLPQLGLENTFITVPETAMGRYAYGYARSDDRAIRVSPGMLDAEAYGVKSSVTDMVSFLEAHLGTSEVPSAVAAALEKTREARYDTKYYAQAMIWEEYEWPVSQATLEAGNGGEMIVKPQSLVRRKEPVSGSAFLNKTGSTNGFGAYVAMIPEEEIGVVILANRNYPNVVRAASTLKLIDQILAEGRK